MVEKEISLKETLQYLENKPERPYLFLDTTSSLITFFTYKGTIFELNKNLLKKNIKQINENDIKESFRETLIKSAKLGECLVINLDKNININIKGELNGLGFNINDLCDYSKNLTREYYVNNKYLKDDEDKDNFGNSGFYNPNDKFRICFLLSCNESDVEESLKVNNNLDFICIKVK